MDQSSGVILELDKDPRLTFGTMDQVVSVQAMISVSAALMLMLMSLDFAAERRGRIILALSLTIAGAAAALVGLCLQSSADLISLWQVKHVPTSVFGLFWYHGVAAVFLNLCWPAGLWLCVTMLRNKVFRVPQQMMLACLVAAVLMQIIAVFVNVSKMGHLMLVLEAGLMAAAILLIWRPEQKDILFSARRMAVYVVIALGLLLLGAWLGGAGDGLKRWNIFAERRFDDPARRHAAAMAVQIGMDHGLAGSGPGTFEWMAAHYVTVDPVLNGGRWRHAHNDYAQFFAEWGWLGVSFFVLVVALPGRRVLSALRGAFSKERRDSMSFHRRTGLICFAIMLTAALVHALVDFPLQIASTRYLLATVTGVVLAMTVSQSRRVERP